MRAETIASLFLGEIVARYGAPCSVHTDQGRNLDGNLFRDVCSLLGVQKTRTTAYHPAGNGLVERLNPLRFQASGDAEIKTVPRHFARANQADRCITLLHCAQRLTS